MLAAVGWTMGEAQERGPLTLTDVLPTDVPQARLCGAKRVGEFARNAVFAVVCSLLAIASAELIFRALGYDFEQQEEARDAWPIFYRQPIEPVGDIFFRRSGPVIWQGRVISTALRLNGASNSSYADEQEVTIKYDKLGFRNPEGLDDWDVVVVGDSFTELGHLPYEELFTTQLGKLQDLRVKNLGVSHTGPLSYVFYLKEYGKSASTKEALVVFFEGNDIPDLQDEEERLARFRANGRREYRTIRKQTSLVRALARGIHRASRTITRDSTDQERFEADAYFMTAAGSIPITIGCRPIGQNDVTAAQAASLESAFSQWAEASRAVGMRPWLVYMPCKIRALYPRLVRRAAGQIDWSPTDLPELVERLAKRHGIYFIDVTLPLRKAAEEGELSYNPIWDTHLNKSGSRIVAKAIADELSRLTGMPH